MAILSLKKYLSLIISLSIVIANVLLDYFLAPTGLLLAPMIVAVASLVIALDQQKIDLFYQAMFTYLLIGLNDFGIKLYGGGIHDSEGQGWVNMIFIVGTVLCIIILICSAYNDKEASILKKIASVISFVLLAFIHLHFFDNLGLDRSYI